MDGPPTAYFARPANGRRPADRQRRPAPGPACCALLRLVAPSCDLLRLVAPCCGLLRFVAPIPSRARAWAQQLTEHRARAPALLYYHIIIVLLYVLLYAPVQYCTRILRAAPARNARAVHVIISLCVYYYIIIRVVTRACTILYAHIARRAGAQCARGACGGAFPRAAGAAVAARTSHADAHARAPVLLCATVNIIARRVA